MSDTKKGFLRYLGQAWLVLVLAIAFGAALAGVENLTYPRIRKNIKDFIAVKLVEVFGEGTKTDEPTVVEVKVDGRERKVNCYPAIQDGRCIGWGIEAEGKGYDTLTLLICTGPEVNVLKGYRVVIDQETPGIGDKIKKRKSFIDQFAGKDAAAELVPVPEGTKTTGNEVWTITGATYSSKKGVVGTINEVLPPVRDALRAARKEANQPWPR